MKLKEKSLFTRLAGTIAQWSGRSVTFIAAVSMVIIWAVSGPHFGFSETWQLVINTGTTIVTFLMVFLIQNTQNRDTRAIHLKLDELIRVTEGAHTALLDLEEMDEDDLQAITCKYEEIAREGRRRLNRGESDTDLPEVMLND